MVETPLDIDFRALSRGDFSDLGDANVDQTAGLILIATLSFVTILLLMIVPIVAVVASTFGAAVFVWSIRLLSGRPWISVRSAVAGFLALFVGMGFVIGIAYTALELIKTTYPVESIPALRSEGLRIITATIVVATGTVTFIGGFATVTGTLRKGLLRSYATVAAKAGAAPLLGAITLGTVAIVRPSEGVNATLAGDVFRTGLRITLSPATNRPHLFVFLSLLFVTFLLFERATETLSTLTREDLWTAWLRRFKTIVLKSSLPIKSMLWIGLSLSILGYYVPTTPISSTVPRPLYRVLVEVTSSHLLRIILVTTLGLSIVGWIIARTYQIYSTRERYQTSLNVLPFGSGILVIGLVAGIRRPALNAIIMAIETRLPGPFARIFSRHSSAVIDFYGSLTVVMALAGLLIVLSGVFALWLHNLTANGPISETHLAPALTGAGTFLTAAFAAETGLHPIIVLFGLIAGLLVWDILRYDRTLQLEVGYRTDGHPPAVVHTFATIIVGIIGGSGALLVYAFIPTKTVVTPATLPFSIIAIVLGSVLLLFAFR